MQFEWGMKEIFGKKIEFVIRKSYISVHKTLKTKKSHLKAGLRPG